MTYRELTRRRGTPLILKGPVTRRTPWSRVFRRMTRLPRKRPARRMRTVPASRDLRGVQDRTALRTCDFQLSAHMILCESAEASVEYPRCQSPFHWSCVLSEFECPGSDFASPDSRLWLQRRRDSKRAATPIRLPDQSVPPMDVCQGRCEAASSQTHLLALGIIFGAVPLLGLLRGSGNLPGRLPERLGCGLRRHGDSLLAGG